MQDAGYGASPKRAGAAAASSTRADLDALADHETDVYKRQPTGYRRAGISLTSSITVLRPSSSLAVVT